MGYEARLELEDQRGQRWTGVHTPACVNLLELLIPLLAEEGLDDGLESLLSRLPASVRVEARLGPNAVGLWLAGEGEGAHVVLKWVPSSRRGPLDALLHLHEGSRAQRAHLMAHRLRAFGLSVPRPLGYLERARAPRSRPSLHLSEWVRRPDLRAWWLAQAAHPQASRLRRQRLLELANTLRRLQAQGLFHGDLHAENVLVDEAGLRLLDLESIRPTAGRDRVVIKGLLRLWRDAEELGGLSRADRLRFLREFLRHAAAARLQYRALWRQISEAWAHRPARTPTEPEVASEEARPPL